MALETNKRCIETNNQQNVMFVEYKGHDDDVDATCLFIKTFFYHGSNR